MTDASHIDYRASYAHESRNDRTIQSIPALPGQHRLGRYGLATSRFFTRRSLLGSSASGLPPPAFTRAPETLPETHKPPGAGGRSRTTATESRHGQTASQAAPPRHIPRQASRSDAVRVQQHRRTQGHAQSTTGHPSRSQAHLSTTPRRPGPTQPAQYPEIQQLRDKISRWQTTLEPPSLAPAASHRRQGEPSDPHKFTRVDEDSSPERHKDGISTPNDSSSGEWVARKIEVIPTGMVAPAGSVPYGSIGQDDIRRISESGYSGRTASSTNSSRSTSHAGTSSSSPSSKSETAARSPQTATQHSQRSRRTDSPPPARRSHRTQPDVQPVRHAGHAGIPSHRQYDAHVGTDEYGLRGHASPRVKGHPSDHELQPPPIAHPREAPLGMRLERIDTTYLSPGTESAPPPSAKPSLASLPRLSSSTQAPLRQGLRAFVSDEDSASSIRSRLSHATSSRPGHPQYPAAAAAASFARRQLSDVPEQMESGVSESEQPVKKIKTKYGEDYHRYDDRLPFEPPQSRRVPEDARAIPSFRDPKLGNSDYADVYEDLHPASHNSAQRQRGAQHSTARPSARQTISSQQNQLSQPISTTKYSFEERDDDEARRFAQSLAEARQELRSIFSENIQMTPPLGSPSRPRTPGPSDQAARREILKKVDETSDELYDRLQERVGKKKEPLRLGYHQDATQLPKPKRPVDDVPIIEDSEDDAHGAEVAKKRMTFRKPPTPYAAAIDSTSGDESAAPSTHDQKHGTFTGQKTQERKKKRRSKRELVGVLKKPADPTPGNTPAMSDLRKSVHFGGATPADVGGDFSPPPHSSQESPSTQAGDEEVRRSRSLRPEERVRQDAMGPIVRSREPSPNPEEYEKYHADLKKGKQRAQEPNDKEELLAQIPHDLPPPLPFDFSKFAGPSTAALDFDTDGKGGQPLDEAGDTKFDFTKPPRGSKQTRVSEADGSDEDSSPEPVKPRIRTPRQKLQLMAIPTVDNEYRKLPAQYLANGVILCKGLTVYPRLRELVWDFSSDLEDVNKRRDRYWIPLADACEKLLMKIQKSLHDQTTKRLLPLFRDILGEDEEPRENSIIFARRAVTAQIKQVWSFTADALSEYNDIVNGADEILDVAGAVENVSQQAKDGFRATYVGFIHMQEYFKHLFDEINEITHCIRNSFMYLHQVPSPSEMATFPDEQIEKLKDSRDDLVEWFDSLLKALRTWRAKVTYQNFEKQLSALRSLDRKWEEADDVQLGMIKALFCFGFCLPRSSRKAIEELQGKKVSGYKSKELPSIIPQQPRKQAAMSLLPPQAKKHRNLDFDEHADKRSLNGQPEITKPVDKATKKKKKKDDESDSGNSDLVLPDLRGRPRSVHQGRGESLDSRYRDHPPTLSPSDPQPPGGMAGFLRQDPAFNALSDEEKLVVIRHMLEQAQQGD